MVKVYGDGGWTTEVDSEAVSKAQSHLDDCQRVVDVYNELISESQSNIDYYNTCISNNQSSIENNNLLSALKYKLQRILSYENANPNFFRQHITDVKRKLLDEINN